MIAGLGFCGGAEFCAAGFAAAGLCVPELLDLEASTAFCTAGFGETCFACVQRLCRGRVGDAFPLLVGWCESAAASLRRFCELEAGGEVSECLLEFAAAFVDGEGFANSRLTSAAGFTPAAIAALAAAAESAGCRAVPRRSGLTMICRS